ncbi:MAG: hypothetical protein OHK93_002814 [Ramalina farinacea]|uniref:Uncharacterized protein n=1 Tax=Ramalina farinacea TaxID=258253 RepID=A0AA43QS65_9LECA|nr:hypothetical protein [Ramalina farinacea]
MAATRRRQAFQVFALGSVRLSSEEARYEERGGGQGTGQARKQPLSTAVIAGESLKTITTAKGVTGSVVVFEFVPRHTLVTCQGEAAASVAINLQDMELRQRVVRPVHSRSRRVEGSGLVVTAGANGSDGRYITDTSKRSIRTGDSTAPWGRPDPWCTYIGESHRLLSPSRRRVDRRVGRSLPNRHHTGERVAQLRWLEQ